MKKTKMKRVLSVMLASAMALSMNVITFAADNKEDIVMATPKISTALNDDGTLTVSVGATGNMSMFDFGIAYDNSKLEVLKVTDEMTGELVPALDWDSAFNLNYSKYTGALAANDFGTYVVFGGTCSNDKFSLKDNATVATVKFKVIGDAKKADLAVVQNSAKFQEKYGVAFTVSSAVEKAGVTKTEVSLVADTPTAPPTDAPTDGPTAAPTDAPTAAPSGNPTNAPTAAPSGNPTKAPSDKGATTAPKTTATSAPKAAAKGNTSKSAKTGDAANVVLPIVAICAAAAAVVVASKKKVEE